MFGSKSEIVKQIVRILHEQDVHYSLPTMKQRAADQAYGRSSTTETGITDDEAAAAGHAFLAEAAVKEVTIAAGDSAVKADTEQLATAGMLEFFKTN